MASSFLLFMQRIQTTFMGAAALVLAGATSAWSQNPIHEWSNPRTQPALLDEAAPSLDAYGAFHVGKVSTSLRPDVLALHGTSLALWLSPARYYYAHRFAAPSTGAALVPSSSDGRSAVLSAQSTGLVRYECTQAAIGTGVTITNSGEWAGASKLESLVLGTRTFLAGRTSAQKLVLGELVGNSIASQFTYQPDGPITDLCLLDWNGDGTAECAFVTNGALYVFSAAGTPLLWVPGSSVVAQVARLPRESGDMLLFAVLNTVAGWTFLVPIRGVDTNGLPVFDLPVATPCATITDMIVADMDDDGLEDVVVANADLSEGAQALVLHQITGGSSTSPGFVFDTVSNGRTNSYPLDAEGKESSTLRLAAGDYDNDGDVDLAGALTTDLEGDYERAVRILPSSTIDEGDLRPQFWSYVTDIAPATPGWSTCAYDLEVKSPDAEGNEPGLDTIEIAIWWQHPTSAGGAVHPTAGSVEYVPVGELDWNDVLEAEMDPILRPADSGVVHQIQFTLVKRDSSGNVIAAGPTLTAYHNASIYPEAGVDPLDIQPDELPGGSTQNPTIRPPSNPPTP